MRSRSVLRNFIGLIGLVSSVAAARGQAPCEQTTLFAPDAAPGAEFGAAVALDGPFVLAGAPRDDTHGFYAGAAYIFRFNGRQWVFHQRLSPPTLGPGDLFGYAVALNGDKAAVAAVGKNGSAGTVYVYHLNGTLWELEQTLVSSQPQSDFYFGLSLALQNNVLVVGEPSVAYPPDVTGFAHVFRHNGVAWNHEKRLVPADGGPDKQFGFSVAIDGNAIAVGARWDNQKDMLAGAAYLFRKNGAQWSQEKKLMAADGGANDQLGSAVCLQGDTLYCGAPQYWNDGGAAYVFQRNGGNWSQTQKLMPANTHSNDRFGAALAVAGNRLLIGSSEAYTGTGLTYIFVKNGTLWTEYGLLNPAQSPGPGAWYGAAMAVNGATVLIGARGAAGECEGSAACQPGAATFFNLNGDCDAGPSPTSGGTLHAPVNVQRP